uniref:Rubrerythrin diiron-binding domain-containing protein n=1 Tax=viral metagenome TaxID=1070528 RepID=A0A6M3ID39_9ZZZZ
MAELLPKEAKRVAVCHLLDYNSKDEEAADAAYQQLENALEAAEADKRDIADIAAIRKDEIDHFQTIQRLKQRFRC